MERIPSVGGRGGALEPSSKNNARLVQYEVQDLDEENITDKNITPMGSQTINFPG
jgi:hypothetical protein